MKSEEVSGGRELSFRGTESVMAYSCKEGWTDADVKCPFYISDSRMGRSVSCEGFEDDMNAVMRFRTLEQREKYMGVYCVSRFESCPQYRCVYGCKYGEGR